MPRKSSTPTKNATLLRLKGTPFKTAADLNAHEEQILKEEWQSIERARVRRELLSKKENKQILAPFMNGFKAKFVGATGQYENLVRVYLTDDDSIQVDIDNELKSNDINGAMESLVKSLTEGLMGGYLLALGLKSESPFKSKTAKAELTPLK